MGIFLGWWVVMMGSSYVAVGFLVSVEVRWSGGEGHMI